MKAKLVSLFNGVLAILAAALGLTGCDKDPYPAPMYGCPPVRYDIEGRVVNDADEPIEGIEVSIDQDSYLPQPPVTTDAEGNYGMGRFIDEYGNEIAVIAHDVDGETNGLYASDTVRVKLRDAVMKDGINTLVVDFKLHAPQSTEE